MNFLGKISNIWLLSLLTSGILLFSIIVIHHNTLYKDFNYFTNPILYSKEDFDSAIKLFVKQNPSWNKYNIVKIPMGILIQAIYDLKSTQVSMKFIYWLKFPKEFYGKVADTISFPEEINMASNSTHVDINKIEMPNYFLITREVETTFAQHFNTLAYPYELAFNKVWVRAWCDCSFETFQENGKEYKFILIGDSDSFNVTQDKTFGVDEDASLSGHIPKKTYWELEFNQIYKTSFGARKYEGPTRYPDYYFNIQLDRHFIPIFIKEYILPILMLLLSFIVVFFVRNTKDNKFSLSSASGPVISLITLLMSIVVSWTHLKSKFSDFIFLETIYITLIFITILSIINMILFAYYTEKSIVNIITWKNNIIFKAIYIPTALITFLYFSWHILIIEVPSQAHNTTQHTTSKVDNPLQIELP